MVSPEKNATTSFPSIDAVMVISVEKPRRRPESVSRSRITDCFSRRSASNRSRSVPQKYVCSRPYISSRSACVTLARDTADPVRRGPGSQRGDVDVGRTTIELFMKAISIGPRGEIEAAGIGDVRIRAHDPQQRIACIETDEQIIEAACA